MKTDGLRLVAGSSSQPDELQQLLKITGATGYLEAQTSSGVAERSKPDPDIVVVALEKLSLPPNAVMLVGDTPYDIEAATRAGVQVIALRCGGWPDDKLKGAIAIYDDPAHLLAKYDTAPAYD
jgi:beta-phosphoglucomutase-like phosphatase (HAD superfamily)